MPKITISIGIMPLNEFRADMIAVARGERNIEPGEPQLWFASLQSLADVLKTDLATVKRVLLPPPEWDADNIHERLGLLPGAEAVEPAIPNHEAELQDAATVESVSPEPQTRSAVRFGGVSSERLKVSADFHDPLTEATVAKPRSDALGSFLDDWEAKHGDLTPEELARAKKDLTPPPRKSQT
jgi:hypothetical protein